MRRQSLIKLAAAVLAISATACFSDPVSGARGGPSRLEFVDAGSATGAPSINYLALVPGRDTVNVNIRVLDGAGNPLTFTIDTTSAYVSTNTAAFTALPFPDANLRTTPGNTGTKLQVSGVNPLGGSGYVRINAAGLTDSILVVVFPRLFTGAGLAAVTGTLGADTVVVPLQPNTVINAGDTLVINAAPLITFNAGTTVSFTALTTNLAATQGWIVGRSATQLKVLARAGYAGPVTISNALFSGNGVSFVISALRSDSITVQHARLRTGAPVVVASPFGANTQVTVTAPTNVKFNTNSQIFVGGTQGIILSQTATSIVAILPATVTGNVMVTRDSVGVALVDSLRIGGVGSGPTTVNASFFPGTITTAGKLLDTISVDTLGGISFVVTGAAAGRSAVFVGPNSGTSAADATFLLPGATAGRLQVVAKRGGTFPIRISNVKSGAATISVLATAGSTSVDTVTTGEPNEPGNQSSATATPISGLNAVGDSVFVYGAMDAGADQRDYYTFTIPASGAKVSVALTFYGTGAGTSDANPDFDVVLCSTLTGTGSCSYGNDDLANAASNVLNPETGSSGNEAGSAQVWIRTFSYYFSAGNGERAYQLKVKLLP